MDDDLRGVSIALIVVGVMFAVGMAGQYLWEAASNYLIGPRSSIVHALFALAMLAGMFGERCRGFYRKMVWFFA
jgi:hypothetical protein